MLIYIFTEHYPSLYKPYFDTQFEQFLKDRHTLRIFSAARQGDELASKVESLGLHKVTSHTPSTLRTVFRFFPAIMGNLLRNPVKRTKSALRIYSGSASLKHNFLCLMRMLTLPLKNPDLCLVHNLAAAVRFTFLRNMYPSIPAAFYYHGGEVAGMATITQEVSKRAFNAADYVFTNTASSRDHAISRGCRPDKITVSPVGFNLDEFVAEKNKTYKRDGILHLLTIGRMSIEKGHIFALKAINELVSSGFTNMHYKLIGDGPLFDELKGYVLQHGLNEYVKFLGHVPRDALYAELKNTDVHLLPSIIAGTWQENQACVVQEAMLFKSLVINSTAGGVPESTSPVMQQFNVEPGNEKMIVESVKRIFSTRDNDLVEMGNQNRLFAMDKYDIVKLNKQILSTCIRA
jgi:colanic acid/amylovoran biosynthesis glycosyltransferase